ncbi:MAG: MerR family transcriptional regulator [Rhodobacter sp.]|nr:MerR family transcriptional regulator [Rhodobacter sp.]
MDKSREAFRTISEVADWLGTPTHVLRFWESRFSQIKPVKRAGGRRYYRPSDMALLGGIKKLLHDDGLTIRGVQKILREQGVKHVAALSQPLDQAEAVQEAEFAQDVEPAVETAEVVRLQPSETAEEVSAGTESPEAEPESLEPGIEPEPETAPEPEPESAPEPETLATEAEAEAEAAAPELEPEAAALEPETEDETPPAMTGIFSSPRLGAAAGAAAPEPAAPAAEPVEPVPEPAGAAPEAVAEATPKPEASPERGPGLAEAVLARLRDGASAEPADLRPIYDRLTQLRARMASDRPDPPS